MMMTMTLPETDEALIPGLRALDEEAVAALVERYWARSYHVARRLTGDPGAAEDVAQETLLRVLRSADRFDASRPFRPWFWKILETTAREHARKVGRRAKHEARSERPAAREGDAVADTEEQTLVRAHLGKLSEKYRQALTLRYLDGLELAEVAAVLGCSEGTVSSRVRRGLDALRASLGPVLAGVSLVALLPGLARAEDAPPAPSPRSLIERARQPLPPVPPGPLELAARALAKAPLVVPLLAAVALAVAALVAGSTGAPAAPPIAAAPAPVPAPPAPAPVPAPAPIAPAPAAPIGSPVAPRVAEGAVRGRVTLAGLPCATPTVRLLRNGQTSRPIDRRKANPHRREASLDADGRFAFAAGEGTADFWVLRLVVPDAFHVREDGVSLDFTVGGASAPVTELRLDATTTDLDLRLVPVTVSGEVVDRASSEPLAGARIHACGQSAVADALGRFRFTVGRTADTAHATVVATAPEHALGLALVKKDTPEVSGLRLALEAGVTLEGRVVGEDGAPVADAEVEVQDNLPVQPVEGGLSLTFALPRGTVSRADGTFELDGFQPSAAAGIRRARLEKLTAHDGLYRRRAELHDVVAGGEPIEVLLGAGKRKGWSGRVTTSRGAPVPHARVVLLGGVQPAPVRFALDYWAGRVGVLDKLLPFDNVPDDAEDGARVRTSHGLTIARTDGRGCFAILATSGRQRVLVTARGFGERFLDVDPDTTEVLVLDPAAPLRGRVQDGAGKPIAGALVFAYPAGTFDGLARQRMIAEGPTGLELVPVTPALVLRWGAGPTPCAAALTDADGRYELDRLAPGSYDVAGPFTPGAKALMNRGDLGGIDAKRGVAAGGPACDLSTEAVALASVRFRTVAAESGNPIGTMVHIHTAAYEVWLPAPEPDTSGARVVSAPPGSRVELTGHGRLARVFDVTPGTTDLGVVNLEKGGRSLTVALGLPERPFAGIDLYWSDARTGLWHRLPVGEATVRLDDLPDGPCELRAFVRRGAFPDEALAAAKPVTVEVKEGARASIDLSKD